MLRNLLNQRIDSVVEEGAQRLSRNHHRPDFLGAALLLVALVAGSLVFTQPSQLLRDLTWGQLFIPFAGESRWWTPIGAIAIAAAVLFVVRCATAKRPLVDLPGWARTAREADLVGALFLAAALAGVILAFATADPKVAGVLRPGRLVPPRALRSRPSRSWSTCGAPRRPCSPAARCANTPAWGSLLVSFFIGAALIAALIDIPLFARTTIYRDSQLMAALVLVRFLVALPVGAVIGGYLTRHVPSGVVTAVGMACAAGGFGWMTTWQLDTLESFSSNIPLVLCGFGFGLALAPVNAALLASTHHDVHGLASALVVVARMVGMLVGISALTTIGLRRYYAGLDENPLPLATRGLRRQDPVLGVLRHAGRGRDPPGAHRLRRRRDLRGRRGRAGARCSSALPTRGRWTPRGYSAPPAESRSASQVSWPGSSRVQYAASWAPGS